MISNYYTLHAIAAAYGGRIAGGIITDIFTQNPDELIIRTENGGAEFSLLACCAPGRNFLQPLERSSRAKRNTLELFPALTGSRILSCATTPADREVSIETSAGLTLAIQLFGSRANVIALDGGRTIVDAFLRRNELKGTAAEQRSSALPVIPADPGEFRQQIDSIGAALASAAIKKLLPLLGNNLVREMLFRAGASDQAKIAELTDDQIAVLHAMARTMPDELHAARTPRIYFDADRPLLFSIIPLAHMAEKREEQFPSIADAIRVYLSASRSQQHVDDQKTPLVQYLTRTMERAERTLLKMEEEAKAMERAQQYETWGKLLMAHLHELHKGMREVEIVNVFDPDRETVMIQLDPSLTPHKNAERWFDKAKKSRNAIEDKLVRREQEQDLWQRTRSLLAKLEQVGNDEQLNEFIASNRDGLLKAGFKLAPGKEVKQEEMVPFRVFKVAGGFTVWAGKSSENNDVLTFKYAKQNDLWFHARGSAGSHVVLRVGTGSGTPTKEAMEQAAAIAAWYSKMKNARNVPVAMCERKFVRKPKGAPAGTVTIEREKLLFVDPALPPGQKE